MTPGLDVPDGPGRRDWAGYALAAAVGAVGLLMMHHPMILSGLRRVQVDLRDSRLINYFLEHNYLWYLGAPGHERFWDPPFFYPARNIAAYSDTMLGIAPLYAAFRAVGFAPDTSFQLWTLALSVLNYSVMIHFLTRRVGLSVAGASAGAFLFAFGSPRANMMDQQTQMTQFLSLISVDALFVVFDGGITSRPARAAAWLVAAAGMLTQLSSGFYPGYFMVLAFGIVSILAIWMPSTRRPFLATLLRDAPWIALAAALGGLAIRPWLAHHLAAARDLSSRYIPYVWDMMPRPTSWLDTGPRNWLGGWVEGLAGLRGFQSTEHASPLGIGLATTFAVLAGLYLNRRRASTRLLATAAVVLALCVTLMPQNLVVAADSLLILGSVAFAYLGRKDHPRTFLLVIGLVLMLLYVRGMVGDIQVGYGLFTLLIASAAFVGRGDDRRGGLVLAAIILGLSFALFPSPISLVLGAACGGMLAAPALSGRPSRPWIEAMVLGGLLAFASLVTFDERPVVWGVALGAPLALLAARMAPVRPPARSLPHIALAGLASDMLFQQGSAWMFFYIHVPGASSLMFVSRVGLILLIPAAIGLGYSIDALRARGRTALALGLGLFCLLEQGTTIPAFDKQANREAIGSLARRIDGRSEAFYYTPDDAQHPVKANLDAMWAGLERGKPTINGYSGHTPVGWRELDEPDGFAPPDLRRLVPAMDRWRATFGRSVAGVQWIGAPEDRTGRSLEGGAEGEAEGDSTLTPSAEEKSERPPSRSP